MTAKEQGLPELPQNVTEDQRRAIQAFVHSAIVPLIEDVIVKKLGQAAIVLRDELSCTALASDTGGRGVVDDAMVEAAFNAYELAAENEGWERAGSSERTTGLRWMQAALESALRAQPDGVE